MKTLISLLLAITIVLPMRGSRAAAESEDVDPLVVLMAQHFVYLYLLKRKQIFSGIRFDIAAIFPQPEENYWAVTGGYSTNRQTLNTYVAAVRLVCQDHENPDCWFLQKLAINQKIVLNISDPL